MTLNWIPKAKALFGCEVFLSFRETPWFCEILWCFGAARNVWMQQTLWFSKP